MAWRDNPATPKQHSLLRKLATSKGLTFETPRNAGHASDQISLLVRTGFPKAGRPQRVGRRLTRNLNEVHLRHTA
jgi:hypothetical protein